MIIAESRFRNGLFIDIVTEDNCTDDSCSYKFYDAINLNSVAVEVVGCATERINCVNLTSCKFHVYCTCTNNQSFLAFAVPLCTRDVNLFINA